MATATSVGLRNDDIGLMQHHFPILFQNIPGETLRWEQLYRVIHKSLRDFRTRLRKNQDTHGRKEHIYQ